jgi:hypothetical protein
VVAAKRAHFFPSTFPYGQGRECYAVGHSRYSLSARVEDLQ